MITHLPIIGLLYQYDEYDTVSTPWNDFPWSIGQDNYIDEVSVGIESAYMTKTLWPANKDIYFNVVTPSAIIKTISMWTALIVVDNFGKSGSSAGGVPSDLSPLTTGIGIIDSYINSIELIEILKTTNQSDGDIGIIDSYINSITLKVVLVPVAINEPFGITTLAENDIGITNAYINSITLIS